MDEYLGRRDIGLEKSRDMGATWLFLTLFFHRWLFYPRMAFGLVSRHEDAVDKADDPDTLFWKLDFHYDHLPNWMKPARTRTKCTLLNQWNHSIVTGYAATQDVARGGRKFAFGMDELAAFRVDDGFAAWSSTQHVSDCRIAISTPKGMAGIFAEQMQKKDASMVKISMHWSQHPRKKRGIYCSDNGVLEILDKDYQFPPDYDFIIDGKMRSPWYDQECLRNPIPAMVAQELDIDYGGSGFPFFSTAMVQAHIQQYACNPFKKGELDYESDQWRIIWRENQKGRLELWTHLTVDAEPPHGRDYVIGCDVATGKGGDLSTNSVASVVDKGTGEKVAEYCVGDQTPETFADTVYALRKWFSGPSGIAYLVWEDNGPGGQFGKHMMQISTSRLYYRSNEKLVTGKVSKYPGFYSNRENKRMLLGEYSRALETGEMVNHSRFALEEMLHYVHTSVGSVEHDRQKSTLDPTSAGENHGDRVIADSLAWRGVGSVPKPEQGQDEHKRPPYASMAWRFERLEKSKHEKQESWL